MCIYRVGKNQVYNGEYAKILFFKHLIAYAITVVPIFTLLPPSTKPAPTPIVSSTPLAMSTGPLYMFFDKSLPSPPFNQSPLPPATLTAGGLFHDSMPVVLFCSLVYFVHQNPLISEIIWYLSFNTLNQIDLIDIYRTFHSKEAKYAFFSSAHGSFSKIDHTVRHKISLKIQDHNKHFLISQWFATRNQPKEKIPKPFNYMETKQRLIK